MDAENQDPNPNPNANPSLLPIAPSLKPHDTNPNPDVNPYPIMFIQTDTSSFKQVVQCLIGLQQTVSIASQNLRIIQEPSQQLDGGSNEDPSSGDANTGADWRKGLPLSLRVRNRAQLAQGIYANPQMDVPAVTALITAEAAEEKLYNQATGEHDYLMSVSDFISKIPLTCTPEFLQGGKWSQQLVLELPTALKQHGGEKPPLVIPHDPWKLLDDLLQRNNEGSDFLHKLVQRFFQQLDLAHEKQQHSSTEQKLMQDTVKVHKKMAGVDFSSGLVQVKIEMDVMAAQFRIQMYESRTWDYSQVINDMERWYAEKIQLLIEDFSSKINDKLDELNPDQLQLYRHLLLNQEPKKEYLTPEQIDEACSRVSQMINHNQAHQARILDAALVDSTSQIGQLGNSLAEVAEKLFSGDDTVDVAELSDKRMTESFNIKSPIKALLTASLEYVQTLQQPPLQIQHQPQAVIVYDDQQRHPQQSVMHPQQQQSAMPMHPLRKQRQKQFDVQAPWQLSP